MISSRLGSWYLASTQRRRFLGRATRIKACRRYHAFNLVEQRIAFIILVSKIAKLGLCFASVNRISLLLRQNVPILRSIPRLDKRPLRLIRIRLRADLFDADLCAIFCEEYVLLLHLLYAAFGQLLRVNEDL